MRYRSVIVDGLLREIPREELQLHDIEQYGLAKRPLFELSHMDLEEFVLLHRLEPFNVSGREITLER